jgi:hypothetical protein
MTSRSTAGGFCLAAVFALIATTAGAEPRPWGVGTHLVLVGDELSGHAERGSDSVMPWLAVQRPVNRTLWLRGELGYRVSAASDFHSTTVPLGIGFRWADVTTNGVGAYLDFYPSLFAYHLDRAPVAVFTGEPPPTQIDRVVPGLMTGFGFYLRASSSVSMTYGLRFFRSAEIADDLGSLQYAGFQVGIDWRPAFER